MWLSEKGKSNLLSFVVWEKLDCLKVSLPSFEGSDCGQRKIKTLSVRFSVDDRRPEKFRRDVTKISRLHSANFVAVRVDRCTARYGTFAFVPTVVRYKRRCLIKGRKPNRLFHVESERLLGNTLRFFSPIFLWAFLLTFSQSHSSVKSWNFCHTFQQMFEIFTTWNPYGTTENTHGWTENFTRQKWYWSQLKNWPTQLFLVKQDPKFDSLSVDLATAVFLFCWLTEFFQIWPFDTKVEESRSCSSRRNFKKITQWSHFSHLDRFVKKQDDRLLQQTGHPSLFQHLNCQCCLISLNSFQGFGSQTPFFPLCDWKS